MQLVLNQKVWLRLTGNRQTGLVEANVVKLGRKWVYLETVNRHPYRAPVGHPYLDGGNYSSPGRIWESHEAWALAESRRVCWSDFKRVIERHYEAPRGADPETLLEVCRMLGITS